MELKLLEDNGKVHQLDIKFPHKLKTFQAQVGKELELNNNIAQSAQFNNMVELILQISRWFNHLIEVDNNKDQVEVLLTELLKKVID